MWELPDACGSSCLKPEGVASGFSFYLLVRIAQFVGLVSRDPVGQSQKGVPFNRREPTGGSNQRNDMVFLNPYEITRNEMGNKMNNIIIPAT